MGPMRNRGVGSWTARRARMSPERVAVVYEDTAWNYRQLHERATRLAYALAARGVRHGTRVAYLGPNHPTFLEALFAAGLLGAVFVPLNWRLAPAELTYILQDSGTEQLITAQPSTLDVPATMTLGEEYEASLAGSRTDQIDEAVDPDEPCLILYTSGTTGKPKGAVLSHANIVWNSLNLLVDVDVTSDEVTLVAAPMFHVAALNQTVLPTLLKGGCLVLMSSFDPGRALALIAAHRVTFLFGVPTMFLTMAHHPDWAGADLSSVRSAICGGAPIPAAVISPYQQRGVTFMQGYGLTEAAPGVLFLRKDDSVRKAGSAGTAAFFTDVRLVRPDGTDAEAGEPGEILVQGPNVMAGYWGRPAETEAVLSADGWLRTGDVGVTDDEGYIWIRDRTKDLIISGGENIYPAEVEDALHQHPAVAECAVIGMPDPHWGEVGRAVVVLREGTDVPGADLLEFLDGRIARYKIPKSVVFADALPRTASGKVLKRDLRSRYGTG
jgi:fatty-acyl-CoA synthase